MITTRIRRNSDKQPVIQAYLRGSWEEVIGTDTDGDFAKVEAWLKATMPHDADFIYREFQHWDLNRQLHANLAMADV